MVHSCVKHMALRDVSLGPGMSASALCSGVFSGSAGACGVCVGGTAGGGISVGSDSATDSAGVVGEGTTSGTGDCHALCCGEAGGFRGGVTGGWPSLPTASADPDA